MSEQLIPTFDQQQKRPLELRVRDMREDGGISEAEARRRDRVAADALVIIRFMADPDKALSMSIQSIEGKGQAELGTEALFTAWLGLTGHLVSHDTGEDALGRKAFLGKILALFQLDTSLKAVSTEASPQA